MVLAILSFIVILGLLVFVHELGHFLTAKRMGVRVDEFGFGFPPRLFGIRRGGTLYSINWIPLGGFVKIKGEGGEDAAAADSFAHKKAWQRVSILSAGVVMNFVLAFFLLSIGFMVGMPQEITGSDMAGRTVRDPHIVILEVEKDSPAAKAGIRIGDVVRTLDGKSFDTPDEVIAYIQAQSEADIAIELERGPELIRASAQPEAYGTHTKPLLGISMVRAGIVQYGFFESWIMGARATVVMIWMILLAFGTLIIGLFQGAGVSEQISGPVGVAVLTGQVAQLGLPYLINFAAMLSINLGILNIIPFPALDGGRVLFVVLEKIKGRPVNARLEGIMHTVGFSLLILLVLVVTYRDIIRYGGDVIRGITGLWS